jgi:hypothetical protein
VPAGNISVLIESIRAAVQAYAEGKISPARNADGLKIQSGLRRPKLIEQSHLKESQLDDAVTRS